LARDDQRGHYRKNDWRYERNQRLAGEIEHVSRTILAEQTDPSPNGRKAN
jgi:hypothetical protein